MSITLSSGSGHSLTHRPSGRNSRPLLNDPRLILRIQQYLTTLPSLDSNPVGIEEISDALRAKYPDYARKSKLALKHLIEQAIYHQNKQISMTNITNNKTIVSDNVNLDMPNPVINKVSIMSKEKIKSKTADNSIGIPSPQGDLNLHKLSSNSSFDIPDNETIDSISDSSGVEDISSEIEIVEYEDKNLINNSMRQLYKPNTQTSINQQSIPIQASFSPQPPLTISTKRPSTSRSRMQDYQPPNNKKRKGRSSLPSEPTYSSSVLPLGESSIWQPSLTISTDHYSSLGGIDSIVKEIHQLVELPFLHPELYTHLGISYPRGLLLHGPAGCGKTALACAIAGELTKINPLIKFIRMTGTEIVSGMSGESESKIRALFSFALSNSPVLIFIDEIDTIGGKRDDAPKDMERRIVAQLLTCFDSLSNSPHPVIVIGATNRPDSLDSALRRAGRFEREICMPIPDDKARLEILQLLTNKMNVEPNINLSLIAKKAVGFVGADMHALTREAGNITMTRCVDHIHSINFSTGSSISTHNFSPTNITKAISTVSVSSTSSSTFASSALVQPSPSVEDSCLTSTFTDRTQTVSTSSYYSLRSINPLSSFQLSHLKIKEEDFMAALKKVQPSIKREGFNTVPNVTWDDIGALDNIREELTFSIVQPIQHPELFQSIGLIVPAGVLLYGPPGCGKTLLAKAIANESGASFLSIKGSELLNSLVGKSESNVRDVFERARRASPCVIFFDEFDALAPRRGNNSNSGNHVNEGVVNTLLTELDGLEPRKGVFVIAATNRPDIIDQAILRPGRLEKLFHVPLPSNKEKISILNKQMNQISAIPKEKIQELSQKMAFHPKCFRFSGADCHALVREAASIALKQIIKTNKIISTTLNTDNMNDINEVDMSIRVDSRNPFSVTVGEEHFEEAFNIIHPSVSVEDERKYSMRERRPRNDRDRLLEKKEESK